ncbi:PLP-dependent aminotransferase family protein [Sphingobium sp. DC-2]|uniref:MocR-like pyridoxine biosynthesis transcription factor PdxR n=1 Tax=Sphingobium sp. DC-2 TaxID=1303256 RepID=UPI0004C46779|nr:PLP-dependent aminotransferase family protein [Sphingobium sp. DC-2]
MRNLTIELDPQSTRPPYLKVADALVSAIETGRLKPGARLPGTRALAQALGLNRNTVDAGYQEAMAQGWLVAEPSRGTFVARNLPDIGLALNAGLKAVAKPAASAKSAEPHLSFTDGAADARLLPAAVMARSLRRALVRKKALSSLGYDDARGTTALRGALMAHLVAERGLTFESHDLMVTRGSQMALFLAAQAIAVPGMAIAVENPGYPLAVAAFRAAGLKVVPIEVDEGGLSIDALEAALARDPAIRAVYVTPHHQYPTTVTMGAARRLRLVELARNTPLTILEDDYDHDYRFEGAPVLPIAARAAGEAVVYIGSLSKLLAPGIRLGYVVAAPDLVARMAMIREAIDRQGDGPLEEAVALMIADGELARHARKARRIYHARRDHLGERLAASLPEALAFEIPRGGLALWAKVIDGTDADRWSDAAARLGLSLTPAARHSIDGLAPSAFRLGYAGLDEREIDRAVELMTAAHLRN